MRASEIQVDFYGAAKQWLINIGFKNEIEWQASQSPDEVDEGDFLREAAWVIYCSGFRESTIRRYFDHISLCFFDWISAQEISSHSYCCVSSALRVFSNRKKHEAVAAVAHHVAARGFKAFKVAMCADPINVLVKLPCIGPVTSLHLAKNLGFEVAKPDRHLVRLKDILGFRDVAEMCSALSDATGDPIRVIDVVLWRCVERMNTICPPAALIRMQRSMRLHQRTNCFDCIASAKPNSE